MAKLARSTTPQFRQDRLIERDNFGQNGLFTRRFSRDDDAILAANSSRSLVPLERGDHQLYWKRMGEASRVGGAVVENRRPMLRDPLPSEASIAKLGESALPEL